MRAVISRFAPIACLAATAALAVACVPEGPPTSSDAGAQASRPAPKRVPAARATSSSSAAAASPLLTAPFEDRFERAELGPDYKALSPNWRIEGGRLCVRGARNHGVWLARRVPTNARIELDAIAESAEGDIKAELWGDGVSGATGTTYDDATSYLTILGGWKNSKHVLARVNEHGHDRLELDVDTSSDDDRQRPVEAGQVYHFKIERSDGRTIEWSVNGVVYFKLTDPDPLSGPGHDHVGFNDWDAPVCFDNLRVTPL
jgi:hypothetical protein